MSVLKKVNLETWKTITPSIWSPLVYVTIPTRKFTALSRLSTRPSFSFVPVNTLCRWYHQMIYIKFYLLAAASFSPLSNASCGHHSAQYSPWKISLWIHTKIHNMKPKIHFISCWKCSTLLWKMSVLQGKKYPLMIESHSSYLI